MRADGPDSNSAISRRFEWAIHQGSPQWLWPETSRRRWQFALGSIERVTRHVLSGEGTVATLEGDADDIGIAAFTSGMGPLLGYWNLEGLLDATPSVQAVIELHYVHNSERMERLRAFASAAVEGLSGAGIRVMVLKGMHTAYNCFPTPGTRPVSDIDLLIIPGQEQSAATILQSLGYIRGGATFGEQSWITAGTPKLPRSLAHVHRDDPWSIDLHTTLDRRYSAGAPMIRMDRALADGTKDRWPVSPTGRVLQGEELVFYLAFHAGLGLVSLSMLRLTELILVIRKVGGDAHFSWDGVMRRARESGSGCCAYPAFRMVNELAPGTVPEAVVQTLERKAPAAVRRVINALSPSTCQRLERSSLDERFMWTGSFIGWTREIRHLVWPPATLREIAQIYRMRFWRLARRRITRRIGSAA